MKSFASLQPLSARHRATSSISSHTFNPESTYQLNNSRTKDFKVQAFNNDLQTSMMHNQTQRSNSPVLQAHQALRDVSNLVGESLLCANLESNGGTPLDLSLINAFNDTLPTPGSSYKKIMEEMNKLKKELEQKNTTIDKLMKENLNLRKEMEEFLSTVDEAREHIDLELKECNNRIQELENEIQEVRAENQIYKQQLNKPALSMPSLNTQVRRSGNLFKEEMDDYYGKAKKGMEDFYFHLNEQIISFMEISKKQYQEFNKIMQTKMDETSYEKVMTCPSSPRRENVTPSSSSLNEPNSARTRNSSISLNCKNPRSPAKVLKTPKTPKTPNSLNLDFKNKTPRTDTNIGNNKSIELRGGGQSSRTSRVRGSCASTTHIQTNAENIGLLNCNNDLDGQKNPTSHALSPKSSLLRAKLKSDMILQEMRRKIGEGFGHI